MSKFDGSTGVGDGADASTDAPVSAELLMEETEKSMEDENAELRARVASLEKDLTAANEAVAMVERRAQIEQEVSRANAVDVETACLLTEVAIAGMDDPDVAIAVKELRGKKPFLFTDGGSAKKTSGSLMSAMVHRDQSDELGTMAGAARASGDRGALLRYLQARRACR